MTARLRLGVGVLVSLLVVGACARPEAVESGGSGAPVLDPDYEQKIQQQARDALDRWDAAVAAAGDPAPRAFVPVGELTAQIGDWELDVGGNNKIALMAGELSAIAVTLPADPPPPGEVRWQDGVTRTVEVASAALALQQIVDRGNHDCDGCTPLQVTGASLTTADIRTSRGPATVPVWEFTLDGTAVRVTRVAVTASVGVTVTPPPWDPVNSPVGLWIESAEISADGSRLTVAFIGSGGPASEPCGADYFGRAVESTNAVVVIVDVVAHSDNEICTAMGYPRTAIVDLAVPLGDRAVLEVGQGMPVAVTAAA